MNAFQNIALVCLGYAITLILRKVTLGMVKRRSHSRFSDGGGGFWDYQAGTPSDVACGGGSGVRAKQITNYEGR
jgi:hypothetical protein